jgi:hypothetical protein
MRRHLLVVLVGLAAGFGLLVGGLGSSPPRADAQVLPHPPPCVAFVLSPASGNSLPICPNVPPCAGLITVTVVGPLGTTGFVSCSGESAGCTVTNPITFTCTATKPPPPPLVPVGASFACGVVKPASPAGQPPFAVALCTG